MSEEGGARIYFHVAEVGSLAVYVCRGCGHSIGYTALVQVELAKNRREPVRCSKCPGGVFDG